MGKYILWMTLFAFVRNMECVKAHNFPSDPAYHADRQTWQVASDRCGNNGLEFDERVLRNIAILQDKEFWIGIAIYRITTPWIETIGCYEMPDGPEIKKSPSIVLCKKRCETYQFFGYSESTENCFCQHNESSSFNLSHCIDNNDSKYSFVYKVFTGHVSDNGDGKCTTLSCRPGSNGLKSADCDASDYLRSSRCDDRSIVAWGEPYVKSKQLCLERFQLLLPPDTYCQRNSNEGIPSWTNVFRAETEVKMTTAEAGAKEQLFCLAGSITEARVLNISRRACHDQLEFVCRTDESIVTTQSQSTNVTRKFKKDTGDRIDKGAVIGGTLGAFLIIVVSAVLIVFKVRSKDTFIDPNTHDYEDTSRVNFSTATYEDLDNTKHKSETAISNRTCDIDESHAPVYDEVNEIRKPGNSISK